MTAPTMLGGPIALPHPPQTARGAASQATVIEQTRATAEVLGAIRAAQQNPRRLAAAIGSMEEACQIPALAARAFWRFPRGGTTQTGASIHLARELARCWGNLDYGIKELSRDDVGGSSEMQAFAWDLETNTRTTTTFQVPHLRDKKGNNGADRAPERLTDTRDIYENNANMGARRVREMIFSILPTYYTDRAQALCRQTNEHGGGQPLAQRVASTLRLFEALGVNATRLEAKLNLSSTEWTGQELASLGVIYHSIKAGEVRVDDEFPRSGGMTVPGAAVTGDSIRAGLRQQPAGEPAPAAEPGAPAEPAPAGEPATTPAPAEQPPAEPEQPQPVTPPGPQPTPARGKPAGARMLAVLGGLISDAGFDTPDARLLVASRLADVPPVGELRALTAPQAAKAINQLEAWKKAGTLAAEVGALVPAEDDAVWAEVDAARQAAEAAE